MRILTFGTFDHLHEGHKAYLMQAAEKGDLYIVVARDQNVEHVKGFAPDNSEEKRLKALQEAFPQANVRLGDLHDYLKPIEDIAPDLIVLGYDQKLPPEVDETQLPCPTERAEPYHPEQFKSSLIRKLG